VNPDLAAFAARHGLSPRAVAELSEAWSSAQGRSPSTLPQSFDSVSLTPEPEVTAVDAQPLVADRYQDLGLLATGSTCEVRRVRDLALNRVLAMKIAHSALAVKPSALARFLEEAQATAQLQHPNVVPVHDIGRLPDGRVWFTMREVRGRTLGDVLRDPNRGAAGAWTDRSLVAALLTVCHAVAYAHARGVLHRDLKPANIMVGGFGEVYLLDWGLAKILGRPSIADDPTEEADETVRTDRSEADAHRTRSGTIAGTPAYMPPEQARGEVDRVDARSDIYALGAILYELLAGRAPYRGRTREVLQAVVDGPPPPLPDHAPPELAELCRWAMARSPEARPSSAGELAFAIQRWLDGSRRREQALDLTARSLAAVPEAERLAARAAFLRARAAAFLEAQEPWQPEEDKRAGWQLEDEAAEVEQAAELRQLEVDQGLHAALRVAPDLPDAHAALVDRYLARHAAAEAGRQRRELAQAEIQLAAHVRALPPEHPVRQRATTYLSGVGALTLHTQPEGAEVLLFRYETDGRRRVARFLRSLGPTPLQAVSLPMGSYVCVLRAAGFSDVRYPVEIGRSAHWDGVPPEATEPHPIWMPPRGALEPGEVYVPGGWFTAGGDPEVAGFSAMRAWCDPFVVQRHTVTHAAYLAYLQDLVDRGRVAEALRRAPRNPPGADGEGALRYAFDGARFRLPDDDPDGWHPRGPVVLVDWAASLAYLDWLAQRTGRPWRLPGELEWEKAARGVDARFFPWGDHFDPSWACTADSHQGQRMVGRVEDFPVDESPYGARDLAGTVQEWCLDAAEHVAVIDGRVIVPDPDFSPSAPDPRVVRGGSWLTYGPAARSARRFRYLPEVRHAAIGFRGVYPVEALGAVPRVFAASVPPVPEPERDGSPG
jgi:formylglycine-generating enzyme required for sulfatase activity